MLPFPLRHAMAASLRPAFAAVALSVAASIVNAQNQPAPPSSPPSSQSPSRPLGAIAAPPVFERVLPNGMKVLVKEDRRAPTVVHMVLYRVGSFDEVNGRTGVAHALEHMMFKGTRTIGPGEFSRRVAERGGQENAFTSRDYTGYYQQIHARHLPEMMQLESDRMANLALTAEEFEKEIRVVMEERRWRIEDRAQSLVYEQLMASAFVASPYRSPVAGWMSDLESMTVADLQAWYRDWYTPSNAVLVVAGDVSGEQVWRLAEQTYGRIAAHALPDRKPQREPEQRGVRRSWVKAQAENPYLIMGFKVPKLNDVERDVDPYALEVLAAVLDLDENGRLTRNLVRGSRIANRAGAGYDMTSRGPALFVFDGTPAAGRGTDEVERALRDEVARIARDGVRDDELERIKTQYVASRIYQRDSLMSQAMEIGILEIIGLSHRDADRQLERIRAVTPAQVQAVAQKYFGDDALTVVTLIPQPISNDRPKQAPAGARH